VPALTNCLHDPDNFVRQRAVRTLGHLARQKKCDPSLVKVGLSDTDPGVRSEATNALSWMTPEDKH
jgi:HEAT repeat protein